MTRKRDYLRELQAIAIRSYNRGYIDGYSSPGMGTPSFLSLKKVTPSANQIQHEINKFVKSIVK